MAEAKTTKKETTKKAQEKVEEKKETKREVKEKAPAKKKETKIEEEIETTVDEKIEEQSKVERKTTKKDTSNENWGILHIYSSYNNTHLHVTDITGSETLVKVTGGMISKSDRLKATPNVAMAAAKEIAEGCKRAGINALYVKLRGVGGHNGPMTPGPGAQAAIRMLTRNGIRLGRIEDVTPVPHDTCRKKGGRRGRRP